mgnify:CR=1 FL=1|tara:strand:+ start:83 stop:541 length:459 start_codon:yes stop_codon:yes gene_type:complete
MIVKIGRTQKNGTQKVKVEVKEYDLWNADYTLALIVVPLLEMIKADKHSSGNVQDEDVPENLRRYCSPEIDHGDRQIRWEYVVNEMLFAMREIATHKSSESLFFDKSEVDEKDCMNVQILAIKCDTIGLEAYNQRIQKGCELFGKYFQSLWT